MRRLVSHRSLRLGPADNITPPTFSPVSTMLSSPQPDFSHTRCVEWRSNSTRRPPAISPSLSAPLLPSKPQQRQGLYSTLRPPIWPPPSPTQNSRICPPPASVERARVAYLMRRSLAPASRPPEVSASASV